MATFISTASASHHLEQLITQAKKQLILISPYIKCHAKLKALIEAKAKTKIDIRIIYGKKKTQTDIEWAKSLNNTRVYFCKDLHAKCYANESSCIITSMNLYDFSQVNNLEMGVFVSQKDDPVVFKSTFQEINCIIKLSTKLQTEQPSEPARVEHEKISTSKLAKSIGNTKTDFLNKLEDEGLIATCESGKKTLTEKCKALGGEHRRGRYGSFFVWPKNLTNFN